MLYSALSHLNKKFDRRMSVVSIIIAAVLAVAIAGKDAPAHVSVLVSGSKGRALLVDANLLFPTWCNPNPNVAAEQDGRPAGCLVSLLTDPRRGDLFAGSTSGSELHAPANDSEVTSFIFDNLWAYAEDTYTDDSYDYGTAVEFHAGDPFDAFDVEIFSPRDAKDRCATATITIRIINHRPVAVSSTLVLRDADPWSVDINNSKLFFFPRNTLLPSFDADTSEENAGELLGVKDITMHVMRNSSSSHDSGKVPVFVDAQSKRVPDETFDDDAVYDAIYLKSPGVDNTNLAVVIEYTAVDAERANSSKAGKTFVTFVPKGDSLLPDAPLSAAYPSVDFTVPRLFGLPSIVLCKFLKGGSTFSDCHFALMGGDLLSAQVSMSAITPTWGTSYIDAAQLVRIETVISDETETEGSYRVSSWANASAKYFPESPSASSEASPLFSARYVLSEITMESPPDAVTTSWRPQLHEYSLRPKTLEKIIDGSPVPLKLYSQYVANPSIQCQPANFSWSRVHTVPQQQCGRTMQYDDECTRALTRGGSLQTMATLSPFTIAFAAAPELRSYAWVKDEDALYVVMHVTPSTSDVGNLRNSEDGGCVFHSMLFREVVPGDVVTSEVDLVWMPHVAGAPHSQAAPLCRFPHASIGLALIVAGEIACEFAVHAPPTKTPISGEALQRVFVHNVPFSRSIMYQNMEDEEYGGGGGGAVVVIPFALHDVVAAVVNASAPPASGVRTPADESRMFRIVPNIAAQTIMYSYSNGAVVYPQSVLPHSGGPPSKGQPPLYVPSSPFPMVDPPEEVKKAYNGSDSFYWAVHARRSLTAVVTAGTNARVHPVRRVSFHVENLASSSPDGSAATAVDVAMVNLKTDGKKRLFVEREAMKCNVDDELPVQYNLQTAPLVRRRVLSDSLLGRQGSELLDHAVLEQVLPQGIAEIYEVLLQENVPETLWFRTSHEGARLVVTQHPRLVSVSSYYEAEHVDTPLWVGALKNRTRGLTLSETDFVHQCGALRAQISASSVEIAQSSGEISGFADDMLRIAVTDGRTISDEIVFILRVHKSVGVDDGFSSDSTRATMAMDMPLLIMCAIVLLSVVAYYRRKIRRWIHRIEAASDSTEDIEEQQHASTSRSAAIMKSIRAMVAGNSVAFSRVPQARQDQVPSSDEEVEMKASSTAAVSTTVREVVRPPSDDDWDDWEAGSCAPHPATIQVRANSSSASPSRSGSAPRKVVSKKD